MPEFNIRQQKVINAKDKNILCLAAPATGKTATLTQRIKTLVENGVAPETIVAFTYTNQAAHEMRKRIGKIGEKIYIGTLHSYANRICLVNGIQTQQWIDNEKFDEIIKGALTVSQANYDHVEYLFVDEFQDTDSSQYSFIRKIPARNRFYVGDANQAIYAFRGSLEHLMADLAKDDNISKYYLTMNYRNPQNILNYANGFIYDRERISPFAEPMKRSSGVLDDSCTFEEAAEEMTWTKDWKNWYILCRTNQEVYAVNEYLKEKEIPTLVVKSHAAYLKDELKRSETGQVDIENIGVDLEKAIQEDKVKVMTIHASKGCEFPKVIVVGAKQFCPEERRICYVAATRAMESLYWCPAFRYKGAKNEMMMNPYQFNKAQKAKAKKEKKKNLVIF